MTLRARIFTLLWAALGAGLILYAWMGEGDAHEAPTGWTYGYECCSSMDCRALGQGAVQEGRDGYRIVLTGEVIPLDDKRIKRSRDEFYHQCTPGGKIDADRSICLYVPDRGF